MVRGREGFNGWVEERVLRMVLKKILAYFRRHISFIVLTVQLSDPKSPLPGW